MMFDLISKMISAKSKIGLHNVARGYALPSRSPYFDGGESLFYHYYRVVALCSSGNGFAISDSSLRDGGLQRCSAVSRRMVTDEWLPSCGYFYICQDITK